MFYMILKVFFSAFIFLVSSVSPRVPDPIQILLDPDPDWLSGSRTLMECLTPKSLTTKKKTIKIILNRHSIELEKSACVQQ